MIVSPGTKINLGLYVTGKRPDGYHDLLTSFYPINFSDSLEIILTPEFQESGTATRWDHKKAPAAFMEAPTPVPGLPVLLSTSGLVINGTATDNLCIKAYRILKQDFPDLPPVSMHLHKTVPMGAGLGGGSADGAATINILNQLAGLGLNEEALIQYADRLGSDCPFFIRKGPQIATGKGEILAPVSVTLNGYTLILVCPNIHVATGKAFSQIRPQASPTPEDLHQILLDTPESWKDKLINQFEFSVFNQFPAIRQIKQTMYDLGAAYASMSGSGSAVYGIFRTDKMPTQRALLLFKEYDVSSWAL